MANSYTATEAKWKGGADEKYVTYDLRQRTRREGSATYPKVKRVYVPGKVVGWQIGTFEKKSGRSVYGVKVEYQQSRKAYTRKAYKAKRGRISYEVPETKIAGTKQSFTKIIEVPETAKNVRLREELPKEYAGARQDVR